MKNFLIYKSSAGSGKTYTLVKEYLRLALSGKNEYRHTLAVTFTNKAAEEMKTRIISSLVSLSSGENSSLKTQLEKEGVTGDIMQKAGEVLKNILHKYSDFSIHTIDSFLLNIVRAFAREIKLQLGYNIEIEDKNVLEKIVEELLDEAGENKELTRYLENFIFYSMEENKGWKIDFKIKELAGEIFKERYWIKRGESDMLEDSRDKTEHFIQTLFKILNGFEKQMLDYSRRAETIMDEYSLTIEDFSYGTSGIMNYLINKIRNSDYDPKQRVRQACQSVSSGWYPKSSPFSVKEAIQKAAEAGLLDILKGAVNLYTKHSMPYNTAKELIKTVYVLGIFKDLMNKLRKYRDENKIMLLSDMNNILMKVISGDNSPFVYEKTGSFYKNFLIDEFQDTSTFQWKNFLPLIINSVSEGNFSMIVGDVKQSIYRWRNGNMKLLLEGVYNDLAEFGDNIGEKNLNDNYRSRQEIIGFNNAFFKAASEEISKKAGLPVPSGIPVTQNTIAIEASETISVESPSGNGLPVQPSLFDDPAPVVSITEAASVFSYKSESDEYNLIAESYKDVEQTQASKGHENKKGGYIGITSTEDDIENNISSKAKASEKLVETAKTAIANGYMQKDILVLTRTKWEGSEAAHYLVDAGFKVVSNESLLLSGSPKVKLLINLLKYIADNRNFNAKTEILYNYLIYIKNENTDLDEIFNDYKNKKNPLFRKVLPGEFFSSSDSDNINPLFYKLSLYELIERLISIFGLNDTNDAYLLRFMDALREFSSKSTNDLTGFVEWWNTNRDDYSIVVPDQENAVRVMTIHKAKGLQSPVVIIPYACWDLSYSSKDLMWVSSDVPPFNESPAYLVRVNKELKNTYFEKDYKEESSLIYLDNFNLLYVAFTRAIDELHVIIPEGYRFNAGVLINAVLNNEKLKTNYKPGGEFQIGSRVINKPKDTDSGKPYQTGGFVSAGSFSRVVIAAESANITIEKAKKYEELRNRGVVLHKALSYIMYPEDAEKAIGRLKTEGLVTEENEDRFIDDLVEILKTDEVIKWFGKEWEVKTEKEMLMPDGKSYKPDRVLLKGDNAVVVDYKTGAKKKEHTEQINKYADILKDMGYKNVEKYILYVPERKIVKV